MPLVATHVFVSVVRIMTVSKTAMGGLKLITVWEVLRGCLSEAFMPRR